MIKKTRIIFRADGNSRIGLGHVVRSLALAQMLRDDFECVFAIQAPDANLQQQIKQVCHGVISLPPCAPTEERFTYELAAYISGEVIVVLDGYDFSTQYQQRVKATGAMLLCIDDPHAFPFVADAVLNQAGGVQENAYKTAPYTKLLLGPKYALLRSPFLKASKSNRALKKGELKVMLNMGGADPVNHTLQLVKELAAAVAITHIAVVVGSAYLHLTELEQWVEQNQHVSLHHNLPADAMCRLMRSCQAAVTSASGVSYEYAAVGGMLFVKQTADNQQALYRFLLESGIALDYQELQPKLKDGLKAEVLEQHVQKQRHYFDGKSDKRLREVFQALSLSANFTLRDATEEDLMLLFEWANDPEVRKRSFNQSPIQLEGHKRWLQAKLQDKDAYLYLASVATSPAAHIRFDVCGKAATISYLIGADFRGKGLGHTVLLKGIERLHRQRPEVTEIIGHVQKDNIASVRAFEKAGFAYAEPLENLPDAYRFVKNIAAEAK